MSVGDYTNTSVRHLQLNECKCTRCNLMPNVGCASCNHIALETLYNKSVGFKFSCTELQVFLKTYKPREPLCSKKNLKNLFENISQRLSQDNSRVTEGQFMEEKVLYELCLCKIIILLILKNIPRYEICQRNWFCIRILPRLIAMISLF